jgi:hypothetical protein
MALDTDASHEQDDEVVWLVNQYLADRRVQRKRY